MSPLLKKHILFSIICFVTLLLIFGPIYNLMQSKINSDYYSHILLIPFITIYLVYLKRKRLPYEKVQTRKSSLILAFAGLGLYILGRMYINSLSQNDYTSLTVFSSVLFLIGSFIFIYGVDLFKSLAFPLLFLFFMVPLPSLLMDRLIYVLQVGSTEVVNALFAATGNSYFREGFIFHLPGLSIEVAKECSGIRSSLALFITALLAGYLFLNTWWKKIILVVAILPIAMFKNGVRIVSLTLLGVYVDPRILQSSLHREGGIPFFIVGLLLLVPILFFLRKSEKKETVTGDR